MAKIKHRVRVRMFLASRWEDITSRTRQSDVITISRGRKDENTKTPPATCTLTLNNDDGAFSIRNPMGPWYGSLGLNNPIEVSKNIVTDTFSRVVPSGFGTADTGQAWGVLSGANATSVGLGGAGVTTSTVNNISNLYVTGLLMADASVAAEFSIPVTDVTGDFVVPGGVFVRGTTAPDHIYARVVVNTDESLTLGIRSASGAVYVDQAATGLTNAAGRRFGVRIVADGDTIAAKLWLASAGEPLSWMAVARERPKTKGFVGLRTALGTSSTNSPMVVTYHSFTVDSMRFSGEVSKFPAASDTSGRGQYVPIEAAGLMRRLGQGSAVTQSAIKRGVLSVNPIAYWPCEEGSEATAITSGLPGGSTAYFTPAGKMPTFEAGDAFACSAPLPKLNGTIVSFEVPTYDRSTGKVQVRVLFTVPEGGVPADESIIRLYTGGPSSLWDVVLQPDGATRTDAYSSTGAQIYTGGAVGFNLNGRSVRMSFDLQIVGANVEWRLSTLGPGDPFAGFISDTVLNTSFTHLGSIYLGSKRAAPELVFGHVSFQNVITSLFEVSDQLAAHSGERAIDRMSRLSTENAIGFHYVGRPADTARLGAQRIQSYLDLVTEAGDADVGSVHERRSFRAVAYRSRTSVYSQTSAVTLDLSKFEVGTPFTPVDDDQLTRNDVTVKRKDGGQYRAVKTTGRLSVLDPPNGAGRVDEAPELSLASDDQLYDLANWLVAIGTVDEARWPGLLIDLDAPAVRKAAIEPAVLDLDVDDRMSVINASSVRIYDPINQLVRGYTETLGNFEHRFRLNLSPSSPYDIGALDDGLFRVSSGTSSLTNALAAGVTGSISVTTTDTFDVWRTTAAGGQFPLDVMIGGERLTLSAISGATSPQTFTISARAVNGVSKDHAAGARIDVAEPWRLGL